MARTKRGLAKKLMLLASSFLISGLLGLLALEVYCRWSLDLALHVDERNLAYEHDPLLGWRPKKNEERTFLGSRLISLRHNNLGFRDHDHLQKTRPRVLFLGDSFVWGFDVEASERFTERLQRMLPETEVLNLGVSGYGTDQEWLLLKSEFDFYEPDLVAVVFTKTDRLDNRLNNVYLGYFKPYFAVRAGGLELRGVPVKVSTNYLHRRFPLFFQSHLVRWIYLRGQKQERKGLQDDPTEEILAAMSRFVLERGAKFLIVLAHADPGIEELCASLGIPLVPVIGAESYPEMGQHWTPTGHEQVALRLYDFLSREQLVPVVSGVGQSSSASPSR